MEKSPKTIQKEPFTRIEGHLKVSVNLDEKGNVADSHCHMTEFRGFERFLEGRHITKIPILATRICGVCSVPHHIASAKAIDDGLNVNPPASAELLRELMLMGGIIHDHLLHLFVLAGPDFALSNLNPSQRGLVKLHERFPDLVEEVMEIRRIPQRLISKLGGQAVHPLTAVPGGMSKPLSEDDRETLLKDIEEAREKIISWHDSFIEPVIEKEVERYRGLGELKTNFAGLVSDENLELYGGKSRIINPDGEIEAEFEPLQYLEHIAEKTVEYTYGKACYVKSLGFPAGICRVGPLSRLNVAKDVKTEHAGEFFRNFKSKYGAVAQETLAYHYARYICTVYAVERAAEILRDDRILGSDLKAPYQVESGEGAGIVEAPRGMLIHHYKWDSSGYLTMANVITPTAINSYPIDSSLKNVAERSVKGGEVNKRRLWHEMGLTIRSYDPCIACATHLDKEFLIKIFDSEGRLVEKI